MTSVKVAVRVRPLNKREIDLESKFIIQMHGKKTTITNTKMVEEKLEGVSDSTREAMRVKDFTFDFSFWTVDREDTETYCDQEKVYKCLGVDVVDSAYEGYNACVFAYGQTGSGKTYTMMGPHDDVGLIPRICQELFHRMTDETTSYRTEVSYLEIYNEKVRDLLKVTNAHNVVHNLRVREHPKEGPYVQGLSKYIVHSFGEIESLMQKGNSVRTTASTNMNDVSSRSHALFTIVFTQATIKDGIPSEKMSKVHLVDLAGSERATATGATGQRLREGGSINKSLVSLGTVIKQLAEVSEKGLKSAKGHFIPYRDSVLTWLLKDSLGGNSRTIMVTTISPADVNYAETLSALRYANRAKNIINRPTVNEDKNVKIIRELREEIERLKAMVGGDIDSISAPKVKERLHESEARMKVLTEEWSEKWKDIANILKEQGTLALRKEGAGVVLDSALPHLIGIDDDILSTGIMLFHLKEGKTRIGRSDSDPPVDIVIAGEEVEKEHCTIENVNNTVTLYPGEEALCCVNGNIVSEHIKLTQGAVVVLGKTNMFRYNNPVEAAKMKEELKKGNLIKSGMSISLSRTSLISQSMTDLYRSSENLSGSGWELDSSHREEQEKIEELKCQIKVLEDRYHAEEEERINKQVSMEIELEKKQNQLNKAYKELEKVQTEVLQAHQFDHIPIKLPKGAQIDDLLKNLDVKEKTLIETCRQNSETLHIKMETLRSDNEVHKQSVQAQITLLDDRCRLKDNEIQLLDDELLVKEQAAKEQDKEDQKVIDAEQKQLDKMKKDFEIIFHEQLEENESLKEKFQEIEMEVNQLQSQFDKKESEMKERWKKNVDEIANENHEIEEAWNDLKDQEKEYDECLKSETLTEKERRDIEIEKEQLEEAKSLLKLEEEKVATKERKILDAIEVEMDRWEQYKKEEQNKVDRMKKDVAKEAKSKELDSLSSKIEEMETNISDMVSDLKKQNVVLKEFEKDIDTKKSQFLDEKEDIIREKNDLSSSQCRAVIKLEQEIISINEELNSVEENLSEQLKEIQEERKSLLLLKKSQSMADSGIGDLDEQLQQVEMTDEDQQKIEQKRKELEDLQAAVDRAQEALEEKVRGFDQARDYELDIIELEKDNLQERVRQDRINALVEQEVKRRMFEEKIQREQKRQLERDKEKREREEEIKRLKDAHHREMKQLKARYEKRSGSIGKGISPSLSNPYATVMSADSEGEVPRRKSTGNLSKFEESPKSIIITIPMYRLQCYGSDSHYEYEVKIVIGDDVWSVMRRYSKFREFHMDIKSKIPEINALVFPPKKLFSKTEKVAAERRSQLEFYVNSVIEICSKIPSCCLHSSKNEFLSKQVLCDFNPFFKKGLFENSKYGTG
ncbi:kinesin-like protein KIF16B isoform X2 [Mercenaria mercenaria]|uniref:kinesin-like protein KIF16B isoform X2 n=1 Tax=Mercenaria mercenaria TaxID=6596 RepID=UPI00234F8CC8|nr:kinesin-like protein KIF16B isoform X2 [Mercenaria mercenaria]